MNLFSFSPTYLISKINIWKSEYSFYDSHVYEYLLNDTLLNVQLRLVLLSFVNLSTFLNLALILKDFSQIPYKVKSTTKSMTET